MKEQYRIPADQATKWGVSLLTKCNLSEQEAATVVKAMITSNLRGVDTHGLILIQHYSRRFTTIKFRPIEVVQESETTCLIDAGDNYGMLAASIAMEKAIGKAQSHGCGVVSVRNSNHFGAAACYSLAAAEKGMLGITTTSGGSVIPPWGGKKAFLGNNPISIAAPGNEFPIILDLALSVVANQRIVKYIREGLPIPEGWVFDSEGNPTTDHQAAQKGMLVPLGGYKGVCLSVMMDLLCGVLSNTGFPDASVPNPVYDKAQRVAHFFMAIDVQRFLPLDVFKSLVESYSKKFHAIPRREGVDRLYMPGEIEYETYCDRIKNGLVFSQAEMDQLNEAADQFKVAHLG